MRNMDFFGDYHYKDDLDTDEVDDLDADEVEPRRVYANRQPSGRYDYNTATPRNQRSYARQSNEYVDMRRRTSRDYSQNGVIDNNDDVPMSRRDHRRAHNINRLYGNTEYREFDDGYTVNHGRRRGRRDIYDNRYRDNVRYRDNRYRDNVKYRDNVRYRDNRYRDNVGYPRAPFIRGNHGQFQKSKDSHGQFQKSNTNTAIKLLGLILLILMIIFAVKGESAYSGVTGVIVILYLGNFLTSKGKRSNKGQ